jgi:hydroxypyruvate isomerase
MKRREFLAVSAAAAASAGGARAAQPGVAGAEPAAPKGRLRQSACRWCYGGIKLDELSKAAAAMGIKSIELLNPDEWETPKQHGLTCAVSSFVKSNPISKGFNRVEHHDAIIMELEERLPLVKAAGIPNQIVFSGNRGGMDDKEGLKNCAIGLKRITPLAEKLGVTIIMELLNSKVDHKDYMCDRTPWGVELDVIRTVTDNFEFIAHYHTGGVPGRREIDGAQELNYAAICRAIVEKGYTGYLGQEFIPSRDPMASLKEAVLICDV